MSNPYASIPPDELHLLYILLDSNLPTGGFVSSSGLESYVKHGFLGLPSFSSASTPTTESGSDDDKTGFTAVKGIKDVIRGVTDFAEAEVGQYAQTTGCFVKDSWRLVHSFLSRPDQGTEVGEVLNQIEKLDEYHEATLLSHVARRASKAQGIAMLTLYGRGLSRPVGFELELDERSEVDSLSGNGESDEIGSREGRERIEIREKKAKKVIDAYKSLVRKGSVPGHLAICWGVITAALGLALDRSIHLYLFLHARSLLSTAVRMNIIGPYASSQMLLHPFKDIIEHETNLLAKEDITTGLNINTDHAMQSRESEGFWGWTKEAELGPATTWPLGEVLMARHDMQHSRIFNS